MKKFAIPVAALAVYLAFWYLFFPSMSAGQGANTSSTGSGSMQDIDFGNRVTITVTKTYFGLFDLPVTSQYGDVRAIHDIFFGGLFVLVIVFVIWEYWERVKSGAKTPKQTGGLVIE